MSDERIATARRALGEHLARLRSAAGFSQPQLAPFRLFELGRGWLVVMLLAGGGEGPWLCG